MLLAMTPRLKVFRRIPAQPLKLRAPVAAVGIFDGVHRGHQAILRRAVQRATAIAGTATAVTFYPHPAAVLAPRRLPPLLLSLEQRLEAFKALGIRATLVIPFTKAFSHWPAERFVKELLVKRLQLKEVVVGHDFGFGAGRAGSIEDLREFGHRFEFRVHVVPPVRLAGQRIASRRIRDLIRKGRLSQAALFLGRFPTVEGEVIRGKGQGRRLGFPTANLRVEAGVLPPVGVYAVRARISQEDRLYAGMANIGYRPTFQRRGRSIPPLLEVHLFNLRRPLYGRQLEVAFLKRLRPERCFLSPAALARQLRQDARRALKLVSKPP